MNKLGVAMSDGSVNKLSIREAAKGEERRRPDKLYMYHKNPIASRIQL